MKSETLFWLTLLVVAFNDSLATRQYKFPNSKLELRVEENTANWFEYVIVKDTKDIQRINATFQFVESAVRSTRNGFEFTGALNGTKIAFELLEDTDEYSHLRVAQHQGPHDRITTCFNLDVGRKFWFGGPESRKQFWPIEKATYSNYSYLPKEDDNSAIAERYWLNSDGLFIYVTDEVPLFIDQNSPIAENLLCFSAENALPYDVHNVTETKLSIELGIGGDAREAHLKAVEILGKPSAVPDELMVRHPIWSSWARYYKDINEEVILRFADEVIQHNFENSQIEIDDDWEICYGALTFLDSKFKNVKALTDTLHKKGFRVTLWVHPFIYKGCDPWYTEAKDKGYLVIDHNGNDGTHWWNSLNSTAKDAAHIDFTNPAAAKWYSDRLKKLLLDTGIDGYKFDAGETSWAPLDPIQPGPTNLHPNLITQAYVRTITEITPVIEIRTGYRTQDLPVFVRMIDKESKWGWGDAGLPSLITTLLQMNLNGYPLVLADMIGGNGYNGNRPDKELFLRWLQANVFMPSLQFSYTPWDFDNETVTLSQKFTQLHANYSDLILDRFRLAVETGEPVNVPVWWADPKDQIALQIFDQFMLGDKIIAAPVLQKGEVARDVYLPKGKWLDGNDGKTVYTGPKWLMNYEAPLETLPYFIRI